MGHTETVAEAIPYDGPYPGGSKVRLDQWRADDWETVLEGCSDSLINKYTSMPEPTERNAKDWISTQTQRRGEGRAVHFSLRDRSDEIVGNAGFVDFEWEHGRAEVGYWLLPSYRGRGYACEALNLVTEWIFAEVHALVRIDLYVDPDNEASRRVASAAGYEFEGILRQFRVYRGSHDDLALYAKLRSR